jgi:hypothetical protein
VKKASLAALFVAVAALAALHFAWASLFWTNMFLFVRYGGPVIMLILLATALGFTGLGVQWARYALTDRRERRKSEGFKSRLSDRSYRDRYYYGYSRPWEVPEIAASAVSVVLIIGLLVGVAFLPYETDAQYRVDHISFTEDAAPDFEARYPYRVANGLMPRSVGDAENVRVTDAGYTDPAQGEWASIVSGIGSLRPSMGVVVKDGTQFERCDWPDTTGGGFGVALGRTDSVGAVGGTFANSLSRQLRQVKRYTSPQWDGVGAWCDGGPWVLIPATKPAGAIRVHTVPAGAWVIDPSGMITWHETIAPGQFPVPVIDPDLAREMVDANRRITREGKLAGWRSVLLSSARVGLERPEKADSGGTDAGNPNYGNAGEFLLRTVDGRWVYVTPLTPVGASETIVALAVVHADEMVAGQLPQVTIHRLDESLRRRSNLELAKVLRTSFDADVQWEAGYEIFELAPVAGGTWSATIGQSLEVKYRAIIEPDGSACLYLFDTMTRVRCSGESRQTRTVLETIGDAAATSANLGELTEEELYDLLEQIARELRNR